ncbi:MAG: oligopeptide/dipeptide ABC transporter ATP-binding protein [Anaerolineaceae bacterium]|nr:oligopeptide/dipeptide ABC transporter ATP-binding protein [Anaerolineaceae bacterium]
MHEPLLKVEGLSKFFPIRKGIFSRVSGHVNAVNQVSFSLESQKTLGLVGESGCGKTTVGRTILGLLKPDGGKVHFNGQKLFDFESGQKMSDAAFNKIRRDMQVVFQDPYACLDPRFTVLQVLTEGMRKHLSHNKAERYDLAKGLLEKTGLGEESLMKYPHQFSGGQRQRIGIARALSLSPKLIICDEPTAALDVSIQSQILNLMLNLKKEFKLSYLFISHNLSIVEHFCDDVCVMYLGRIVEKGRTRAVFDNPLHPYSAALLAAVPVFEGRTIKERQRLAGEIPSPSNLPGGCHFHPRCAHCLEICRQQMPDLIEFSAGHYAACHRALEFLEEN